MTFLLMLIGIILRSLFWLYSLYFFDFIKIFWVFPGGSAGKESSCSAGDLGSIPGLGRSPGEGKGYPLQYSSLDNSTDSIVNGVTKSQTGLSNFHVLFRFFYQK